LASHGFARHSGSVGFGCAFAVPALAAAMPMHTTAIPVLVIAPRSPEVVAQPIYCSSRADVNEPSRRLPLPT
jgi:hypothetical protein